MIKFNKILSIMTVITAFIIMSSFANLYAGTIHTHNNKDSKDKDAQKTETLQAKTYRGVFDLQKNTVSNLDFYTTNYGIFAFDVQNGRGGGFWPRRSQNQYIFAGGFWFGAQKYNKANGDTNNLASISYNPWSGRGWYVPGRINEGGPHSTTPDTDPYDAADILKYRTYFSIDFKTGNGEPTDASHNYNWPIWDASTRVEDTLKTKRYFGNFIPQTDLRNLETYKKGPAFISGEDIFSTYKDTDLSRYEIGVATARERGYPLRLQVEQMIYSWGFGDYRDFIFIKYELTNYSTDTLWNCWLAPVMDVDIARQASSSFGAGNDRVKFYECDGGDTLNMALQWSNTDRGERGFGFGYLGFDFLESPAVVKYYDTTFKEIRDNQGNLIEIDTILTPRLWDPIKDGPSAPRDNFVRKDSAFYANSSQLGLVTFNNWPIDQDKQTDDERYQFMAAGVRQGDDGPGDKRFMMATGPFHMQPADTVRVVVGVILANTAKGGEADGTCEDLSELVRKDKFAQLVYDNNFRAPVPPDRSQIIKTTGINNGNIIEWDNTSELSVDVDEKGLDFMGYAIFRARRTDLDTFDVNTIAGSSLYPSGKGPFGWKLLRSFGMQPAFRKANNQRAGGFTDPTYPLIDNFDILGPYTDNQGKVIDSMAIRVMRRGVGLNVAYVQVPVSNGSNSVNTIQPYIESIDTSIAAVPWGNYWDKIIRRDPTLQVASNGTITRKQGNLSLFYINNLRNEIFDSVLVGVAHLDRSLLKFNPLFYEKKTLIRDTTWYNELLKTFPDGVVGSYIKKYDSAKKVDVIIRTSTDSIYLGDLKKPYEGSNYLFDVWVPKDWRQNLAQGSSIVQIQDSLYSFIKNAAVKLEIADLQQRKEVREEVISPYMKWATNNRTFTDIGDDNFDGYITEDEDPAKTERLLNNIDYYYKVVALDEGDFLQPTNLKFNTGGEGLPNFTTSIPTAAPVGNAPEIQVIHVDSSLVGGLYNFRFFSVDPDRVIQKFDGDSLILKFEPVWSSSPIRIGNVETEVGLYRSIVTLTSKKTGDTLYFGTGLYEDQPCNFSFTNLFSENASSVVLADSLIINPATNDTIDFGTAFAKGKITRTGRFFSGDFTYPGYCYTDNWRTSAYGMLGFSFDYTISQYAGRFRPDSLTLTTALGTGVTATTPVAFINDGAVLTSGVNPELVMLTQEVGFDYKFNAPTYGSFNNGPGIYEVEFLQGGTETVALAYDDNDAKNTFNVPYLNVKVRNITEFKRPSEAGDSVLVKIPTDMPHLDIPPVLPLSEASGSPIFANTRLYPDPRNLAYIGKNTNEFIGKFNMYAFGFVSNSKLSRTTSASARIKPHIARPADNQMFANTSFQAFSGIQGKYAMTGLSTDGKDTVDFVNILNISGVQFVFDFPNKGFKSHQATTGVWGRKADYNIWSSQDFKPGDKVYLRTTGGAQGLPLPGATVIAKVSKSTPPNDDYTDDMLNGINIVPNPYFLTHQGVKSPYDSKIYFTKLPKKCTIEIYTIAGDLVKTIEHDELNNEGELDRNAVQVWDLLSKNASRVQSQAFVAIISTPNGAQTVKNFSVVVGGFRLLDE